MKKFISLALCVAMVCGLLAMNVSAALISGSVFTQPRAEHVETFENGIGTYLSVGGANVYSEIVDDGTGNKVARTYLPGGDYAAVHGTVGIRYNGGLGTDGLAEFAKSQEYEVTFDVYPVENSSGLALVSGGSSHILKSQGAYFYPRVFALETWTTIKKVFSQGTSTYYAKAKDADEWTLLVEGTDYHPSTSGMGNGSTFYVGTWAANADYANKADKYGANFMEGEYYMDNFTISRKDIPTTNALYSFPKEFTFTNSTTTVPLSDTVVTNRKYSPSSSGTPGWHYYVEFDVKRTGGDAESGFSIEPVLGDANGSAKYTRSSTWIKNVPTTLTNYRLHIGPGGNSNKQRIMDVWKRADGETTWTVVPSSKEDSAPSMEGIDAGYCNGGRGGVYGITLYYDPPAAAGYDGSRADNGGATFTLSNFLVYSATNVFDFVAKEAMTEGYDVTANVVTTATTSYLPIVAAFDGDMLIGINYNETTGDSKATYNFANADENTTYKLYFWNPLTGTATDAGYIDRSGPYTATVIK